MLQIISLISFLFTLTCTGSSLSNDEECSALLKFKQSIFHQDDAVCAASWFQTFHSWRPTSNASDARFGCCSWYGVECSNDHGHVIGLDLSESFLCGHICGHINSNSTLFNLVHLQSLNLAINNFGESQIPSEIDRLKQLRSLNLSDSGFSGQVPNEISQLMHLSSLDLSQNPLKLQSPSSLKNLVQNLTGLEELDLSQVDISSSVPQFLANFSSLRSIRLVNCFLQNEFPVAILELPYLEILSLAFNTNLIGSFPKFRNKNFLKYLNLANTGFFGILPESIGYLNHLIFLRLTGCSFSGRIPSSLSNLTQLTYLTLASNKFTGFVPSLVYLSKLNVLDLSGNKFEKGRLPNWLGKLTKLERLYANDMHITGEFPPFLANLTTLSDVVMGNNSLIGHIPSWFFNLTQLSVIGLERNQLQGPISSSFSKFKSLTYLSLSINNFQGRVDVDMFLQLNKLEALNLGHNNISLLAANNYTNKTLPQLDTLDLSSCNLKEFPAFLRFQNKMKSLFLDSNKIDGLVPVWMWNNSQETLEEIGLSQNSITGFHQHPRFLPWRRLQSFEIDNNQLRGPLPIPPQSTAFYDASSNHLTGQIPPIICDVKSLKILDLFSNNLSGTLPPCFGSLTHSLLFLDLSRNNFHGKILDVFKHGSTMESIDMSENRFMGQLPRSLSNYTNLKVLCLGDNSFDDVFPSWLGTLSKLQVLVLRSNKFYGPIQGSTTASSQFPSLRIIDLSNNHFSGQMHKNYFQNWTAMKSVYIGRSSVMESDIALNSFNVHWTYTMILIHKGVKTAYEHILTIDMAIDLSCNHLEGEIPVSLQDLQGIQSLNLSHNHFTGRVFPSMGNLQNLESLDLSLNELSGVIPQQLVQLGFLEIFNVSFNNLEGRIPQGKQFNTFENGSYEGNPRLCGKPLSKECQSSKAARIPPASNINASESLFPSDKIDWIFVFCGVASGLVVGVIIGNFLNERYTDQLTKTKGRWVIKDTS